MNSVAIPILLSLFLVGNAKNVPDNSQYWHQNFYTK